MSALRFDGKVALVTGSGRGLGRAYVKALAAHGASVVVNDPGVGLLGDGGDHGPAKQVVDEIRSAGGNAVANFDSVGSKTSAQAMIAQAIDAFGRIDIIVNNAGNFMPDRPFAQTDNSSFVSIWQVHVLGSLNVIRAAWPHMVSQRSGRIVNIGSHVGYLGSSEKLEYSAAKAALHGITRSLSLESVDHGIAVNLVAPGALTRPVREIPGFTLPEEFGVGAFSPNLVAPIVLWLAHEQCPANGEAFGAMSGTITRIKMAETLGYFNKHLTCEDVRDHFDEIMDEETLGSSGLIFGVEAEARGGELMQVYLSH